MLKAPPGYSLIEEKGLKAIVKDQYLDFFWNEGFFQPQTLFQDLSPSHLVGRTKLMLFVKNDLVFVIRRNFHGGIFGKVFKDVFLDGSRPHRELFIMWRLREVGIKTAEPIASFTVNFGPFKRTYLITSYIQGGKDFLEVLENTNPSLKRREIFYQAGALIRKIHDLGVYHPDLQLKNFLLKGEDVYILDFDKAYQRIPLPLSLRFKNLFRFLRSLEKARTKGMRISPKEILSFWKGYAQGNPLYETELRKRIRFLPFAKFIWRIGWKIEGIF
jgi:3-deoxy-D-manno-octulosonic acid kinase